MSKRVASEMENPVSNEEEPMVKKVKVITKPKVPINSKLFVISDGKRYPFDPKNLIVGTPKKVGKYVRAGVSYRLVRGDGSTRDVPMKMQTPVVTSKWGFSMHSYDGKSENAKGKIECSFMNEDSALLATFRAMDAKVLEEVQKHADVFFPGQNLKPGIIEHCYGAKNGAIVKQSTKNGCTYSPYVNFKIKTSDSDGIKVTEVNCFPSNAKPGSKETIEVTRFCAGCEYRAQIEFEGIYVGDKLSPVIRADVLQLISEGQSSGMPFIDSDNEE